MATNKLSVWIMLFFIFSVEIMKVDHYIQFFTFKYYVNSGLHTLLAPIPYRYETTPSRVCDLLLSLEINLINFLL